MFETIVAVVVAGIWIAGYGLGHYAAGRLPARRLGEETKATVRVVIGILVTFTALVLSLLTNSAKNSFDNTDAQIRTYASQIIALDQLLESYGEGAAPMRSELRAYVADALAQTWPSEARPTSATQLVATRRTARGLESVAQGEMLRQIEDQIRALTPQTAVQQAVAQDERLMMRQIMERRWQIIESDHSSIPAPFMVLLVGWLTIIFASFGLTANGEPLVHITAALTAISLASVIYLILDLDGSFDGMMAVSSAPLRAALAHLSS